MDDLRSTLADFDPDAPLPGMPDPWAFMPTPTTRPGPPWAMAEMIAAEPGLADRIAARLLADGSAEALASLVRGAAAAGAPVVATGCGTSEHAAMAAAAILRDAWRSSGFAGRGPVVRPGVRAGARSAGGRRRDRDQPRGRDDGDDGGDGGRSRTRRRDGVDHRQRGVTGGRRGGRHARDRRDGPRLVPHRGLPVADRRRGGDRLGALGRLAAAPVRWVPGSSPGSRPRTPRAPTGDAPTRSIAATIAAATHLLVVGTGVDRVTARELALKVEEAAWVPSAVRDLETFLHGHLPATGPETARAAHPHRARRARRACQARPPGARGGRVARHASRGDPRGGRRGR